MARNGDVVAACKSHAETLAWAATSGFSASLSDSTKLGTIPVQCEGLLLQRWPQHYLGRDADNRPVVFEQISSFVPDDFARKAKLSAEEMCTYYTKHLTLQCALLREASAQEGRLVSRLVHIFDASGVSLRAHLSACARDTFHRVAAAADAHFPETLGVLLIINAGGPFPALWSVGKTFVDERTRSKIEVFPSPSPGSNFFAPGGWPARLRQLMGGSFPEVRCRAMPFSDVSRFNIHPSTDAVSECHHPGGQGRAVGAAAVEAFGLCGTRAAQAPRGAAPTSAGEQAPDAGESHRREGRRRTANCTAAAALRTQAAAEPQGRDDQLCGDTPGGGQRRRRVL
jgi:hypothetical protein